MEELCVSRPRQSKSPGFHSFHVKGKDCAVAHLSLLPALTPYKMADLGFGLMSSSATNQLNGVIKFK